MDYGKRGIILEGAQASGADAGGYSSNLHEINARIGKLQENIYDLTRSLRAKNEQLLWPEAEVSTHFSQANPPSSQNTPLVALLNENLLSTESALSELAQVVSRTLTI